MDVGVLRKAGLSEQLSQSGLQFIEYLDSVSLDHVCSIVQSTSRWLGADPSYKVVLLAQSSAVRMIAACALSFARFQPTTMDALHKIEDSLRSSVFDRPLLLPSTCRFLRDFDAAVINGQQPRPHRDLNMRMLVFYHLPVYESRGCQLMVHVIAEGRYVYSSLSKCGLRWLAPSSNTRVEMPVSVMLKGEATVEGTRVAQR